MPKDKATSKQHCKSEASYFKIINKTNEYKLPNKHTEPAPSIFKIPGIKIAKAFLGAGGMKHFCDILKKKEEGDEGRKERSNVLL